MLEVTDLNVHYGAIHALKGVSLKVADGAIVTLIGANGAGKSTTLRALSGLLKASGGTIRFGAGTGLEAGVSPGTSAGAPVPGEELVGRAAHKIVHLGLCHCPEGRRIFPRLSVQANLELGAYIVKDKALVKAGLEEVYTLFPRLKERLKQAAGTLSGGEQQMLAIGRAFMGRPKMLMLDEPSLGIAPILVQEIFRTIKQINTTQRMTILLVEQNANMALKIADYAYVLETGKVVLAGKAADVAANPRVKAAYLGH